MMDISERVLEVINILLRYRGNILEIGSGYSTKVLANSGYKVWSVESDPNWMLFKEDRNITYIHAPLKSFDPPRSYEKRFPNVLTWYDPEIVFEAIDGVEFSLILIDGPRREIGRSGIFMYRDKLNWDIPVIFDDTNRINEWSLSLNLAANKDRYLLTLDTNDRKQFTVMLSSRYQLLDIVEKLHVDSKS